MIAIYDINLPQGEKWITKKTRANSDAKVKKETFTPGGYGYTLV